VIKQEGQPVNTDGFLATFLERLKDLPDNSRVLLQTVLYGAVAGAVSVFFMMCINFLFTNTFIAFATRSLGFFLTASFMVVMGSSLLVGILISRYAPDEAGSGIPQLKAAYWKEVGYVPWLPVLVKFIAGVLSIGGGASLGREGPTIYIGGGIASNVSGYFGTPARQRRSAIIVGASAGIAAAFNAPLAAIAFILEEIVGDINSRFVGRIVLSSVVGAFVVFAIIGEQPAFRLPIVDYISPLHYLIVPIVAIIASLVGVVFQHSTLFMRAQVKRHYTMPQWLKPCCGGLIVWIIGAACFYTTGKVGVFGLGYEDLSNALANNFIWWAAGVLMIAKVAATVISLAFGGCGGVFSPLLFIGGMCGYFLGGIADLWIPLTPSDRILLSAVGMSTCLGVVVREPLTSLLIVFEMTHQFSLVPALMVGTIISVIISHAAAKANFYDSVLIQDGHELIKIRPPLDIMSWQNLPVSSIANPNTVTVKDLKVETLRQTIESHPYNCFPILLGDNGIGLITRDQILSILDQGKIPNIQTAITCYPDQAVRDVGNAFIESPHGCIIVVERKTNKIAGIITLHDLLRAQASIMG